MLVNEQARLLELGSGGFDVLYANLTRGLGLPPEEGAHVMALPYTPGQVTVCYKEEADELADSLDGMPVVLCTVHSQVAPVCAGLCGRAGRVRPGAGGALPVSLSDTVRELKDARAAEVACAVAPCLDGDAQFVSAAAALAWAKAQGDDAVVCSVGPGIVGTGSRLGHGALALADAANAATALGGVPSWPSGLRTPTSGSATAASRTTPRPCSTSRSASSSSPLRPTARVGGGVRRTCRSPTWAAARGRPSVLPGGVRGGGCRAELIG